MQVLVVGGGMQGLCIACALAREGHDVQLAERETPGQRASWVAAGLLTPSSPWKYPQVLVDLCFASEALFPDFVAELVEHTGIDPEYEVAGMLYPEGAGVRPELLADETVRRQGMGFAMQHLQRGELDALQPGLAPCVTGAVWQPRSARVRPPRLMAALRRRARDLGVLITNDCEIVGLLASAGRGGRGGAGGVRGALTSTGQELPAEAVVLAAGAWSTPIAASLGLEVDVRPVRGQILLLRGEPGLLGPTVNNGDSYLVPRRDGRILVGSTMEDVGFEDYATPEVIERLRLAASAMFPACAEMEAETWWAGLRPGTPDRVPYIGPVPEIPGLVLATGHFRNGILLGPVTAAIVADVLGGRQPCADIEAYAPRPVDRDAVLVPAS